MADNFQITWGQNTQKTYEQGIDRGVIYFKAATDTSGLYTKGYAWPGLISVNEEPSGGELASSYQDGRLYSNFRGLADYEATISTFGYPEVLDGYDMFGNYTKSALTITEQAPQVFAMTYRTFETDAAGLVRKKIHLIWNLMAEATSIDYTTIAEEADPSIYEIKVKGSPVLDDTWDAAFNYTPSCHYIVDTSKLTAPKLAQLEKDLYGSGTVANQIKFDTPKNVRLNYGGIA